MRRKIFFIILALMSTDAFAAAVAISAIPTSWRLQNYVGDRVVVFFTGSPCNYGNLSLESNATQDDKNRFWSLIMAAKVARKPVVVYYEDAAAPVSCVITSFMLQEE